MAIWTNDGTTLADFNDGSPYLGGDGNTVGIADGQIKINIVTPGDEVGVRYNAGAQAARYLEFDYTIASDAILNESHTVMHAWSRDYATDLLEIRVTPNGGGYSVRVYDPVAMVSGTPSTMLTKGFKYRIKLAISSTEATLTIDNRASIVFSGRAWSSPQMVFGAMSWGQYFTETLLGTQYFDNFSLQQSPPLDSGLVAVPRPLNVADKRYIAKVSKADGTYIGVWKDMKDDLRFTQQINTPGTTTTVQLARSAENTIEKRSPLTNHLNAPYTDHLGEPYFVTSRTSNTIGPDTDVENGHLIDIFAVYGRFEPLTDHMGRAYTDSNGNPYMVSVGAPLGRPVFRGKIIDYGASYGRSVGVTVTIASHGMELTKGEVIKSGSATTVTYSTTPIESIIKSILDTNPGRITYDSSSISNTGVSVTSKFVLNTKLEGIKSVFDQTAAGWYWYVNPANNLLYLRPRSVQADHVFYLGKHLNDVEIKKSAEDLRNRIYFVGGDNGSGTLYRVYEDSAAIAEHGLGVHRITDRRFTQPDSARRYAEKIMSRYARPIYTSTVVISAANYDIENIEIGQTVGFRNSGNFVDDQVLQIVSLQYEPTRVTLDLGEILDDQRSIIADMSEELSNEQYQELPTSPI